MKGGSGKFRVQNIGSQAEIIRKLNMVHAESALVGIVHYNNKHNDGNMELKSRLHFILKKFNLDHSDKHGVMNFFEFSDELEQVRSLAVSHLL